MTLEGDGPVRASYAEVAERVDRLGARARAPRRRARRPGGDVRLEHPAPLRAVPRGALLRRRPAHAEHPPVPRAGRLHRQPRRGRRDLRRRLARRAAGRARAAVREACATSSSWATATSTRCPAPSPTSSCSRRPARASSPGPRSTSARRRRSATRAAPPATPRASSTRTARSSLHSIGDLHRPTPSGSRRAIACWPSCRCSTSTRGACPSRAALTGAELLLPGPLPAGRAAGAASSRPSARRCWPACRRCSGRCSPTSTSTAATSSSLRGGICGGSAVPRKLMEGFERHGVRILQAWGMTETSPIVTVARPPAGVDEGEEHWAYRTTPGPDGAVDRDPPERGRRRDRGARAVGRRALLRGPERRRQVHRRRLAAHGRHRRARRAGLRAHHRPRQGPHQVRRRVDLVGRGRDAAHRPPGGASRRRSSPCPTRSGASGRWPAWRWPRARASRPATCASTCPRAWPSGSSPTPSPSSTRCRRRASASSTRRSCAGSWPRASWRSKTERDAVS